MTDLDAAALEHLIAESATREDVAIVLGVSDKTARQLSIGAGLGLEWHRLSRHEKRQGPKRRRCLKCGKMFNSEGAQNRRCEQCNEALLKYRGAGINNGKAGVPRDPANWVTLTCTYCGREFERRVSMAERNQQRTYCCRQHYWADRVGKRPRKDASKYLTLTCGYCGQRFKRLKSMVALNIEAGRKHVFCCQEHQWASMRGKPQKAECQARGAAT